MKAAVILYNAPECEMSREEFEYDIEDDGSDDVDEKISRILDGWILSVGDVIKIVEIL